MVVNLAVTLPIPDIVAVYVDPAVTGTIGPSAPERITSPDRNGAPYSKLVAASHANASHGLPRQSAPLPRETSAPSALTVIVTSARSGASTRSTRSPST